MDLLEAINRSTCFQRHKVPSPFVPGKREEKKQKGEKRKQHSRKLRCAGTGLENELGKHELHWALSKCPGASPTHVHVLDPETVPPPSLSLSLPTLFPRALSWKSQLFLAKAQVSADGVVLSYLEQQPRGEAKG